MVFGILIRKMSEHKQPKPTEGIVTSDALKAKKHLLKKILLFVGSGLIVALLILCLVLIMSGMQKPKTASNTNTTKNTPSLVNVKQQLTNAQTALKNATSPQAKATAYYDLGGAYMNNNEISLAITAYNNSLNVQNSGNPYEYGSLINLGYAYNMAGQKANAISTFNKLIGLLQQSSDPVAKSKIPTYQNIVNQLQAGESI